MKAIPGDTCWTAIANKDTLSRTAYQRIVSAAARSIAARGSFSIVLAGGKTPCITYRLLCAADTDWSLWRVYFGDERCLPADDVSRNSRMAAEAWLNHVSIPPQGVHPIPAELGAEPAARDYARTLEGVGDFDLVLLGLGEDGHTASLFPGHDLGAHSAAPDVLAVLDAPKPPAQRVSLSAARLSRSRAALFLVAGESKRGAVMRWRNGADIPALAIRPRAGVEVLVESTLLTGS